MSIKNFDFVHRCMKFLVKTFFFDVLMERAYIKLRLFNV